MGTTLKLTPLSFTGFDLTDSCSQQNFKLLKKTNLFLLSCVHVRNWESTNFNLIPRGFSATFPFTATARIFSSFQLLSIVLRYKVNSLFFIFLSLSWPNLHRGTMKKKELERQEVLWPYTHARPRKNSNSYTYQILHRQK